MTNLKMAPLHDLGRSIGEISERVRGGFAPELGWIGH
jgi:hypothetical protein